MYFTRLFPVVLLVIISFLVGPVAAQSVLNEFSLQADVWRPAKPIEPGVDAQGDLGLSIPLMTVPGRGMDYPVALSYRSSIRVKQESGWIGLGWHFDPGSITRDVANLTVGTGGSCTLYNVDYTDNPTYQQDMYNVTTPGGSFTMGRYKFGIGTQKPNRGTTGDFFSLEWEPWKIEYETQTPVTVDGQSTRTVRNLVTTSKEDYSKFIVTAKNGTRYIFAVPTLSTFVGKNYTSACESYEYYVSTWRLVAILGADYDGNAIPSKSSPGSWVKFEYTAPVTSTSQFDSDEQLQSAFLTRIVTPTHRAEFTTGSRASGILNPPWQNNTPYKKLTAVTLYEDYGGTSKRLQKVVLDQDESRHSGISAARMGLEGIEFYGESDTNELPGYKFTYWASAGTPSATDNDAFGYYNTSNLYTTDANTDDGKAWSLRSILHPTGGYEEIEYENDQIDLAFGPGGPIAEDYTYNQWNALSGTGGTGTYTIDGDTQRQGGVRVTTIRRYANQGGALIDSTAYGYGTGRLSGVPSKWWLEVLTTDEFFKPANRGRAAVFYTSVGATHMDGTSSGTTYSTDFNTGVDRLEATLYRYNGAIASVVQGNQDINWGIATGTSTSQNGSVETTRVVDFGKFTLANLSTFVSNVDLEWIRKGKVNSEETEYSAGKQWRQQNGTSVTSRIDYTYDPNTGLPVLIKESGEVAPDRTTDITYAYEIGTYSGMDNSNILTAVARRDVYEDLATDRYYRSSLTTYKEFTPGSVSFWKPFKSYEWISGTSAFSTSAPAFSDWANTSPPAATLWHNTATFTSYDDNGRTLSQDDARGNTTDFFYGDNTSNCSNTPTTYNNAFLTCVERDGLQWKMDYGDGRIITMEDPNGDLAPRYTYDANGRLTSIRDAANSAVTEYAYFMSRVNQAGSYSASSPNSIMTTQQTGTTSYVTKEYLDAWGRSVQQHQQSGSDDYVAAVDYDSEDRPSRVWKPYLKTASGHSYQTNYAAAAAAAWDGSPEANAFGYPYAQTAYRQGRPDSTYQAALSGTRGYSRSRYMSEAHRDLSYGLLTGRVRYTISVDEEGIRTYSYVDGYGRELMQRRFAEHVEAPSVPATVTASAAIFRGGGALLLEGGGSPGEEKKKKQDDDGGVGTRAVQFDWDTDTQSYTPPANTPPHLVTYVVTLTSSGNSSATVNFTENSGFVGQYIYNTDHGTNEYHGSFVAYEGVAYGVEAKAGADPDLGGSASAEVVMTIKVGGRLRVVMDTRYDRDVADNPVTVYPPNYFFPPHGAAVDWKTTFTYDTRGRMLSRTTPDGGTVQFAYDRQGNLRFSQDAQQAVDGRVSFTTYDSQNRPLASGEAPWSSAFTALDPNATASFETTTGNWLSARFFGTTSATKPSTASYPWSVFASEITSATILRGKGRLTAEAVLSGDGADEKWQLTLFSYDADGRIVKKMIHTESASALATTLLVTLNRQGQPAQQQVTVGTNNFYYWWEYDARGNLSKAFANATSTKPLVADVEYAYNAAGLVSLVKYGGSFNAVPYAYNSRDWLVSIGSVTTTTYPFAAAYAYEKNGRIKETDYYNKQSPAANKRFRFGLAYDSMSRLLGADYSYYDMSTGWVASAAYDLSDMSYDPSGNLTAMKRYRETGTLIDNLTYQYTAGTNKLDYTDDAVGASAETWDAEDGAAGAYAYDANGAMTKLPAPYSVTSAAYDARGLVTKVVTGTGTTTYRYNSAGERYWKAGLDYYALDGALQLGVFTTTGTLKYWNIIAGGRVVGRLESGARKYYHQDHLGTTRAVVEGTCSGGCTIREAKDYDAWGIELAGRTFLSGSAAKEGYTGKERDLETGLDYFGARYYMPSIGRWNAVDPLAEKFPGWSPYNYVLNNPVQIFDPNGKEPCCVATIQLSGRVQPWGSFEGTLGLAVDTNGEYGVFVSGSVGIGFGIGFSGEATGSFYPGLDKIQQLEDNPGFSFGLILAAGELGGTGEAKLSGVSPGISGGIAVGLGIAVYAQRDWTKFLYKSNGSGSGSLQEYLNSDEGQRIREQLGLSEEDFDAIFEELEESLRQSKDNNDDEDN